jgi:hypothetical protein
MDTKTIILIVLSIVTLYVGYYLMNKNGGSGGGGGGGGSSGGSGGGGGSSGGGGGSSGGGGGSSGGGGGGSGGGSGGGGSGGGGNKLPCGFAGPSKVSLSTAGYNNPSMPVSMYCVPDSENILYLSSQNQQYFFGINQTVDSNNNTTGYLFIQNADGVNVWNKKFSGNGQVVLMATTGGQLYALDGYGNTVWCGICKNIPVYNTTNAYLTLSNTGVLSVVYGSNQIVISN